MCVKGIKHLYGSAKISPFFSLSDPGRTHKHTHAHVCTIILSSEIILFEDRWHKIGLVSGKFMAQTWAENRRSVYATRDGRVSVEHCPLHAVVRRDRLSEAGWHTRAVVRRCSVRISTDTSATIVFLSLSTVVSRLNLVYAKTVSFQIPSNSPIISPLRD